MTAYGEPDPPDLFVIAAAQWQMLVESWGFKIRNSRWPGFILVTREVYRKIEVLQQFDIERISEVAKLSIEEAHRFYHEVNDPKSRLQ